MTTNIRISTKTREKLNIIKKQNNYKSVDEVINKALQNTVNEDFTFKKEQPAFTLIGETNNQTEIKEISYTELKNSNTGDKWIAKGETITETATILFIDQQGAFIRFTQNDNIGVEYYHFL